jgi:hypothetical protein
VLNGLDARDIVAMGVYPEYDVFAVGDATLDAAAVVCRRTESLLAAGRRLYDERVIVLAAAHRRA